MKGNQLRFLHTVPQGRLSTVLTGLAIARLGVSMAVVTKM